MKQNKLKEKFVSMTEKDTAKKEIIVSLPMHKKILRAQARGADPGSRHRWAGIAGPQHAPAPQSQLQEAIEAPPGRSTAPTSQSPLSSGWLLRHDRAAALRGRLGHR